VRIDANTPENLRKYIDRIDDGAKPRLQSMFESGELNADDLSSIGILFLGHHKGMFKSEYIESKMPDREGIVDAKSLELPLTVFNAFSEEIAKHTLETYYKYCGRPEEPQTQSGNSVSFDMDSYFGEKVQGVVGESLENDFSDNSCHPNQNAEEAIEENENLGDINEILDEIVKGTVEELENSGGQAVPLDTLSVAEEEATGNEELSAAAQYRIEVEDKKKEVFISPEELLQVKAFKDIQVYTTTEHFDNEPVVFDAVIYDTVN